MRVGWLPPPNFMFYVYLLKSKKTSKLYIGFTEDLRSRFYEHNQGRSKATKYGVPWKLLYYEAFLLKKDAILRENQLKKFKRAYVELKKRIENSINFKT